MFYIYGCSRSVDNGSGSSNMSSMVEVSAVEGTSAVGTGVGFVCLSVSLLLFTCEMQSARKRNLNSLSYLLENYFLFISFQVSANVLWSS